MDDFVGKVNDFAFCSNNSYNIAKSKNKC